MKKKLYRLTVVLLTLVLLVSGGYLVWKNLDYRRGVEIYRTASETAGLPPVVTRPAAPAASSPQPDEETDPLAALLASVDLAALREVNPDVTAWIVIPDTEVSYPVVQSADNAYYLNRTWTRERSAVGAIFMECQCAPDFSGFNTILYGHRMNNESMFGVLKSYNNADFWREHPAVYLVTDSGMSTYEVFAAHEVGIREIVYRLDVEKNGWQQEFIDFCLERSVIDAGVVPAPEDKMLTLSTCTGRGHATRWVVQAVLAQTYPFPDEG